MNTSTSGIQAFDGVQSIRYNNTANTSSNFLIESPSFASTNKVVTVSAKLSINSALSGGSRQFGLQTAGSGANAMILIDENGGVFVQNRQSLTTQVATLPGLADTWVDLSLTMDLSNRAACASVNGNETIINTTANFGTVNSFDTVQRGNLFSRGAASTNSAGQALWDSSSLQPVPEPASMLVMGAGLAALASRKGRKRREAQLARLKMILPPGRGVIFCFLHA